MFGSSMYVDPKDAFKTSAAFRLWAEATPLSAEQTAAFVFGATGNALGARPVLPPLRYHRQCPHPRGGKYTAVLAALYDGGSFPSAVLRHYRTPDLIGPPIEEVGWPTVAQLGKAPTSSMRSAPEPAPRRLILTSGVSRFSRFSMVAAVPVWAAPGNRRPSSVRPPADAEVFLDCLDLEPRSAAIMKEVRELEEAGCHVTVIPQGEFEALEGSRRMR
jgi:hypothetical protein